MNRNVNVMFVCSQPRVLPSVFSTALTEQREVTSEPPGAQEQKYETKEEVVGTVVSRERF
jgi:hypothetical protein